MFEYFINFILIIHILVTIFLVFLILFQQNNSVNLGISNNSSSQAFLGVNSDLTLLTYWISSFVAMFFITSLILSYSARHQVKPILNVAPNFDITLNNDRVFNSSNISDFDVSNLHLHEKLPQLDIIPIEIRL